jgi:hypothetical protein
MTSWRKAGFTFVKYVDIASQVLRSAVKDSAAKNMAKRTNFYYKHIKFNNGVASPAKEVKSQN